MTNCGKPGMPILEFLNHFFSISNEDSAEVLGSTLAWLFWWQSGERMEVGSPPTELAKVEDKE